MRSQPGKVGSAHRNCAFMGRLGGLNYGETLGEDLRKEVDCYEALKANIIVIAVFVKQVVA